MPEKVVVCVYACACLFLYFLIFFLGDGGVFFSGWLE